jgi:hypothetical protein
MPGDAPLLDSANVCVSAKNTDRPLLSLASKADSAKLTCEDAKSPRDKLRYGLDQQEKLKLPLFFDKGSSGATESSSG